jgi:hypothetical protein
MNVKLFAYVFFNKLIDDGLSDSVFSNFRLV